METGLTTAVSLSEELRRELEEAGERARASEASAKKDADERDAVILRAADAGASLREIAVAVGLSHMGVQKAVRRMRAQP